MEASIHLLKKGYHLVAASRAKVFHHKHPSERALPFNYGSSQLVNYLYNVVKHFEPGSRSQAATLSFLRFKVFLYWLGSMVGNNEARYLGARAGLGEADSFFNGQREKLEDIRCSVCDKHLKVR